MTPPDTTASHLERQTIVVGGVERSYWVAEAGSRQAPVLVVLHGLGMTGRMMAEWTGLAMRGPAAGFETVFPDGVAHVWDDTGRGRTDGVDDDGFAQALVATLGERPYFLVGLSNGGFFAERLARAEILQPRGLVLVASSTRQASRELVPSPKAPTALLCLAGTADRSVPYAGGRSSGLLSWIARRRARRHLLDRTGRAVVGIETLARDWATANGCDGPPAVETPPATDLPTDRLTWEATDGRRTVVLYRIGGGAHGWPGGPQYLPPRLGRIPRRVDATGILLSFAQEMLHDAGPSLQDSSPSLKDDGPSPG